MSKLVPIGMPLRGLITIDPFVPFDSGYARELTNNLIVDGRLTTRPAIKSYKYNASNNRLNWYDAVNNSGIEITTGDIITVSSSATTGTIGGASSFNATTCIHMGTEYVFGCREPRLAAAPFTAWTFTTITISAAVITCGVSHKGRFYVAQSGELNYSGVAQTTGAMYAYLDYSQYLEGQAIFRMFSVSAQPGNDTQNVLVLFGSGGKVLVFSGTYPDSDSWQLIGNYNMPSPVQSGFIEIDGDIWVTTQRYSYWFRDLFSGGAQTAYENSPSRPIENLWQAQTWSTDSPSYVGNTSGLNTNAHCSHAFYLGVVGSTSVDAIICQAQTDTLSIASYQNVSISFIYHRKYKAWSIWYSTPFFKPVRLQAGAYYALSNSGEIVTLDDDNFVDEYTGGGANTIEIETSWKTPYVSPFSGTNQKLEGVRPFWKNSVSGYFEKIRAIFDYSDYNAPYGFYTQSTVTQINPGKYNDGQFDLAANTWNHYNEFKTLGGLGAGFSLQFTMKRKAASAAAQSQQLYAASALVNDGGAIF
jgi:hypothetical protein